MARQSRQAGIGLDKPYITIYSAIAEEGFYRQVPQGQVLQFRRSLGIPQDAVVLVTVARLFALKGHDFIIQSAQALAPRFPHAMWLFVGDGNLAGYYKRLIDRLGLSDRFRFTGLLPPSEIPLVIQASDILVHCSLREGLARAIPQAMLCRRPVVAFDLDGTAEMVGPQTGRLVRPGDLQGLTAACAELIADPGLRVQLGQQGWVRIQGLFEPGLMVSRIETVYKQLAGPILACQ
jgi:glycosyltransferase involved in cell wall biosynthesis